MNRIALFAAAALTLAGCVSFKAPYDRLTTVGERIEPGTVAEIAAALKSGAVGSADFIWTPFGYKGQNVALSDEKETGGIIEIRERVSYGPLGIPLLHGSTRKYAYNAAGENVYRDERLRCGAGLFFSARRTTRGATTCRYADYLCFAVRRGTERSEHHRGSFLDVLFPLGLFARRTEIVETSGGRVEIGEWSALARMLLQRTCRAADGDTIERIRVLWLFEGIDI